MKKLEGKVAIVTGAARGIGFGVARLFVNEGATVAICDINAEKLSEAAAKLSAISPGTISQVCDITSSEDVDAFVDQVAEQAGGVDILVNTAAIIPLPVPLQDEDEGHYVNVMNICLHSIYRFMKRVFPLMKDNGGKIINFTSMAGIRGTKGAGAYGIAKAGVIGLTKVAANDWGEFGINVNCIAPMAMNDDWAAFMGTLPEGTSPTDALGVRPSALGFVGQPEQHIAPAVLFLASADSDYITGLVMPVDGGQTDIETKPGSRPRLSRTPPGGPRDALSAAVRPAS